MTYVCVCVCMSAQIQFYKKLPNSLPVIVGCIILHFPVMQERSSFLYLCQHSYCHSFYFNHSRQQYLIAVSVCILLMARDAEHLFMSLFPTHISSLVKCLLVYFAHFLVEFFVFCCKRVYFLQSYQQCMRELSVPTCLLPLVVLEFYNFPNLMDDSVSFGFTVP